MWIFRWIYKQSVYECLLYLDVVFKTNANISEFILRLIICNWLNGQNSVSQINVVANVLHKVFY